MSAIDQKKVTCPYCGHEAPLKYDPEKARCVGVWVRCKARHCRREFEVKINTK